MSWIWWRHDEAFGACETDKVGQVVFTLGIIVGDLFQKTEHVLGPGSHDAGIAECDQQLLGRRLARLDDGFQLAMA